MKIKQILEGLTDEQVDQFHTELDDLVHKHLGHSSDEEELIEEATGPLTGNELLAKMEERADEVGYPHGSNIWMTGRYIANWFKDDIIKATEVTRVPNIGKKRLQALEDWLGFTISKPMFRSSRTESKELTEEQFDEAAGEKDACYHKVKSRYKVWPSAYASGALVKCRKVGAKNWGNSKKD